MWWYRSFLAILGGGALVFLSAALARTAASVAPPSPSAAEILAVPPPPAPVSDTQSLHCVDLALQALKADRVSWLDMEIWQKIQLPGCVYEAEGSYRLAPDQRFRLEMHTHMGEAQGTLLMVSDGRHVWRAIRPGEGAWENVTRLNLPEVFAVMNGPDSSQLRAEFLQRPHFQGMTPLLRNLRDHLVWARNETIRRGDAEQVHLVGVWPAEEARRLAPPDQLWPTGLPRQCHLYLDARTYCPRRVEWWGPAVAKGADRLLVQMEFRNAIVNCPLAADVCARLFAFQPGESPVEDETSTVTAEVTTRARELAQRNAAP